MRRVTGFGGLFFKAADPKKMYEWYEKHLGLQRTPDGSCVIFPWREADAPDKEGMTVWSIKPQTTKYFDPSTAPFMMNFRVDNMNALLEALRAEGVTVEKHEDSEYGHFAWVMDPEGNRIELWQPPAE